MTSCHDTTADCLADITESLMPEFQDDLPLTVISDVVLAARRDLTGQVIDQAFPEMLERLAHIRLVELRGKRTA